MSPKAQHTEELRAKVLDAIFFSQDQAAALCDRLRDAIEQTAKGDFVPADYELGLAIDRAQRIVESIAAVRAALAKAGGK